MSGRTRKALGAAAVTAYAVLHLYTGVRAIFENGYHDYTAWSWTGLGLWLLCLLALDVWLYFFGGAELLRSLEWSWGFSTGMYGVMVLCALLDWTLPDLAALVFVIWSFVTPVHQLSALSWPFRALAGIEVRTCMGASFCLFHLVYVARLRRRAMKEGALPDGPVGPGTGTVG
nr:hypothetical protein [uncultured Oscillibacter sp.]